MQQRPVRKAFRNRALVQRCQWHKRENVVSHLAKHEQAAWRQRLQCAYNRPDYDEALLGALETLLGELDERNQSAAGSLAEGLDETLTLHRLGVYGVLGRSFKTTNCLGVRGSLVQIQSSRPINIGLNRLFLLGLFLLGNTWVTRRRVLTLVRSDQERR